MASIRPLHHLQTSDTLTLVCITGYRGSDGVFVMELTGDRRCVHFVFEELARNAPDTLALTFTEGKSYTRGDLWQHAREAAAALLATGSEPGDRLMIMLDNRFEFIQAWMGSVTAGLIAVTPHTAFRGVLLANMMESMAPSVIVTQASLLENVTSAIDASSFCGTLVVCDDTDIARLNARYPNVNVVDWATWVDREPLPTEEIPARHPSDICSLVYTSGTTGPSKGCIYAHATILFQFLTDGSAKRLRYTPEDVHYVCAPLFHGLALLTQFLATLYAGGRVVMAPRFSVTGFWRDIYDWECTKTCLAGQMALLLWQQPVIEAEKNNKLTSVFLAPVPVALCEQMKERWGVEFITSYGTSDTGWCTWMPEEDFRLGSAGMAVEDVEIELVDDYDEPVPPGEPGEMIMRPKLPFTHPQGYFNRPEATVAFVRNGWYHTGDVFRCDEDGFYFFLDRKKDYMRRGGENISSVEVEEVLMSHPDVLEVAVYGVPSDLSEDDVMAALIVNPGASREAIGDYAEANLPYYAVPRYYDFREDLPKTPTQRIMKVELRREGIANTAWDRGRARRPGSTGHATPLRAANS
jgi:crotonobetaine/carnitine-CoA ligase